MLKINFIVVDRTKASYLRKGEEKYLKRLKRFVQYRYTEVKPEKIVKGKSDLEIAGKEGKRILSKLEKGDYLIALDRSGKQYNSRNFASWLKRLSLDVRGSVCFTIGGPVGLSEDVLKNANSVFSLSKMTMTHEMCRLLLMEQIYRAFTIIEGHKYHK
ncbi:23S rRNA (pseudouridine(1915)-N(3))-methyltransferase RlmH [Thermodesulfobacteriota bacterium]